MAVEFVDEVVLAGVSIAFKEEVVVGVAEVAAFAVDEDRSGKLVTYFKLYNVLMS